jgi:prepilin-type N-terminal cleavage/methylation domain-containing protein
MNRRGFTLIELLIVISIIGILITLVAVTIRPIQMNLVMLVARAI